MHGVDRRHNIGCPSSERLGFEAAKVVSFFDIGGDAVKCSRNACACEERLTADLPHQRLSCNLAVSKAHTFIPRVTRPFEYVLEQIPMERFEMRSIELPARAFADFDLVSTGREEASLMLLKLIVRFGADPVFEGIGSRIGIARHGLPGLRQSLKPRHHFRRINIAANVRLKYRIRCRLTKYPFKAIVGVGLTQRFKSPGNLGTGHGGLAAVLCCSNVVHRELLCRDYTTKTHAL